MLNTLRFIFRAMRPTRAGALTLSVLAMAGAPWAVASPWKPEKSVTLVVPYAPGGGTDALARALARDLTRVWGQSVIVENLPGADGSIGTRKVIETKPDGYTLLVQISSIAVSKHLPGANGFDPLTRLAPVSVFAQLPGVLAVNSSLPVKTVSELVAYCKTASNPCSYGTTESVARLMGRQFVADANLPNLIIANYKGGGQLITDLVANNINMSLMGITAALPHYKSGSLKLLATAGKKRSPVTPEVPSSIEAGYPAFDGVTWYGVFAPKGAPADVVDAVSAAVREAVRGDTVRNAVAAVGAEALGSTPEEFEAVIRDEVQRMDARVQKFSIE